MSQTMKHQPTISRVISVPIEVAIIDMNGEQVGSRIIQARAVVCRAAARSRCGGSEAAF